ncbi:MAG: DUF948 domain-containing protein [Atopobiaceae bacterium]|nr:DUF948 domain-containing protein [Atopobiaceae bacterium]
MDVLRIALVLLAAAGIWAVVELALTFRKTRDTVDELTKQVGEITTSANDTIEQLQPIIVKVDGMVTDLEPAVKQVEPLLEKATTAVDVVTVDLASVNDILVDVSSVTDTATNVTSTVSKAANSAVSGVAGVVGKFTGGGKSRRRKKLAEKTGQSHASIEVVDEASVQVAEPEQETSEPKSYFTYGSESKGE